MFWLTSPGTAVGTLSASVVSWSLHIPGPPVVGHLVGQCEVGVADRHLPARDGDLGADERVACRRQHHAPLGGRPPLGGDAVADADELGVAASTSRWSGRGPDSPSWPV